MPCECKFDPDPDDPEEDKPWTARHYKRQCLRCDHIWYGLHCPHDRYQNPCPGCGHLPVPVPET